ncbi:hypothetical protein BpHYR1_011601 [Brachionus plicatilis]|uniref:Uncharacterized protein n=1 Tax=Brachionus plicatilis TaxID=10195 RepID=A0A3M7S333_BRAPC|nr:hypothetical protein BpHYR1_011601 [Brachionus plicatilis]
MKFGMEAQRMNWPLEKIQEEIGKAKKRIEEKAENDDTLDQSISFNFEPKTWIRHPNNSRRVRPSKPVCGSDSSVPSERLVQPTRPSKPAYTADLAVHTVRYCRMT